MERLNCGIKDYLQDHFVFCHWSDEKWKSSTAGGGGNKKTFQFCVDSSGTILYSRALQGHLIDPILQDNVVIPDGFFKYIYHVGCNQFTFNHQFRIDNGKSKIEQSPDSILSACGSYGQITQGS